MIKLLRLIYLFFLLITAFPAFSQQENHTKWTFKVSKNEVKLGEEIELIFQAEIDKNWDLYSNDFDPDLGPTVTTFTFNPSSNFQLLGTVKPIKPKRKYDDTWGGEISYFNLQAEFRQKIKVTGPLTEVRGTIEYQECSDVKCIPHEIDFVFKDIKVQSSGNNIKENTSVQPVKTEDAKAESIKPARDTSENKEASVPGIVENRNQVLSKDVSEFNKKIVASSQKEDKSLLAFFVAAFIAGILALLTPCVYPMIPMTVTFFSTHSENRRSAIFKAITYGVSIIVIYTVLGLIVSFLFGPDALNYASTHWITNLIFFFIFVFFALSFFGLFEITLPSSFVNKVDAQSDKGGYYGVFFMAFTIVLVSFSCTGPIVTTLLLASAQGEVLMPTIGMLGYSLAFALPFSLFAIFPNMVQNLPKSGGWLNSVKVILGFIELALAFKFLSVADQVYHWGILDRDIFIVIWIAIAAFMGFYLLGKFRLYGDTDSSHISIFRMLAALTSFGFVIYLVPGLFGAPLKALSGLLPPMSTHDFNLVELFSEQAEEQKLEAVCEEPKYQDLFHIPHGIKGYYDLQQALKCAKETGKPVFIDFTGHGCTNCRRMEANVWSDSRVLNILKNQFVVVALYIDERTPLEPAEVYTSDYDNKIKNTIGNKNFDIEKKFYWSNAQPYYCLVDHKGKLLVPPQGYNPDINNFINFLNEGIKEFRSR